MKPLNEVLSSICSTLECEYVEWQDDYMNLTEGEIDATSYLTLVWYCQIRKNGKPVLQGFASPTTPEGITETTKETAREWLLLSLITKCINS